MQDATTKPREQANDEDDLAAGLATLATLDEPIGRNWLKHARATGAADDLLHVVIGDGCFTTKIDGWIHAATLTTRSIARFVTDGRAPQLDLAEATAWAGGNAAARYGRWQTDFHWKIDTRLWQYLLYLKFMRDAYRDAIDECPRFSAPERSAVQRLVREFFDQAEIAMAYRWEFIERGRRFARHPDPTAGAATHGYAYHVLLPLPEIPFAELPLGLDARAVAAESGPGQAVPAFPRIDRAMTPVEAGAVAEGWLARAKEAGIADRWLRVRLGERMVPTRFNGWETAIAMTLASLVRFASGERARLGAGAPSLDLADYAVRFGLCQAEFQRRLRGGAEELATLLETECDAIQDRKDAFPALAKHDVGVMQAFSTTARKAMRRAFDTNLEIVDSWLPELAAMRPLHPRFAPPDPVEPLPWESKNPASYQRRMKQLGYVI